MFRRQLISCFRHTSPLKQIRTLPSELSGFDELKLTLKVVAKMNKVPTLVHVARLTFRPAHFLR